MRLRHTLLFSLVALAAGISGEPPAVRKLARTDRHGDLLPPRAVARIGRVLPLRHAGSVHAVAFAPDGKVLASGGGDGAVRMWQVRDGKQLLCLLGHEKGVYRLAFAPDGKTLASGDGTGTVRRWDAATGRELDRMSVAPEYRRPIAALAFSADGTWLAAGSDSGLVWWETGTGRRLGDFDQPTNDLRALTFAADGKSLAIFCRGQFIRCDTATGKILHQNKNVSGSSAAFSRDGKHLATGAPDGRLHLCDARTGKPQWRFPSGAAGAECLALSADGSMAASANSHPSRLCLTNLDTGDRHWLVDREDSKIGFLAVAFSPDGKLLATGDWQSCVRIWDTATHKELHPLRRDVRGIAALRLAADGKSMMVHSDDGKLYRRRLPDGELIYSLGNEEISAYGFALSARGDILVTREEAGIHVRDAATGDSRCRVATPGTANFVDLSPDGRLLAWASYNEGVHLCDTETGREVRQLKGHKDGADATAFSPDGRSLVTAAHNGPIRVWDVATGQVRRQLHDRFHATKLLFSPDGKTLAVCGWHSLFLWETKDYRQLQEIGRGRGEKLAVLAFSADGKTLACADDAHAVVLYDLSTGEAVDVLRGHEGRVRSAAFSGDGKSLYTGSEDGTILVWDLVTPPTPPRSTGTADDLPAGAALRLGDVRFWSKSNISSLALSADGKTLAVSASPAWIETIEDPSVRLLEVPSGKERRRLKKLPSYLMSVVFSPDGQSLAGVNYSGLSVWNLATGARRYGIAMSKGGDAVAYSPDGKFLAVSEANSVSLREATTGQERQRLEGHKTEIVALAFSPDGKLLVSGSPSTSGVNTQGQIVTRQGALRLWNVADGTLVREIAYGGQSPLVRLHFSADGKTLTAWRQDKGVSLRDVATGREIAAIAGKFPAAAFSADGKFAATGGPVIHLWELPTGRQVRSFPGGGALRLLTFSANGKTLAGVDGGRVRLWDVARGEEIASYVGHRGGVQSLSCTADGRTLISAGSDGTVRVWDVVQGKQRRILEDREADFQSAAVSVNGQTIAAMDAGDAVTFWSANGEKLGHFAGNKRDNTNHRWLDPKPLLTFSADGRTAFAGREDGALRLWQAGLAKVPRTLGSDEDGGIPTALAPDGAFVACIPRRHFNDTGVIRLRRLGSGAEMCRLKGEDSDSFWTAAFSPDDKLLAASRSVRDDFHGHLFQHRLLFWEVATGKRFLKIDLPHRAEALAFSADGKLLATASGGDWRHVDRTIRIWDVAAGKLLEELPGHGGLVNALLFSPDGRRLFSGGADGVVLVWDTHWPHPRSRRTRADLSDEQLRAAWADLAGADVAQAFRALGDLAAVPRRSLPFLRAHLPAPPPVDRQRIARLIADLDSDSFAVRNKARMELEKQGELAEDALRKTLRGRPSLEARRRIEELLERLQQFPPSAEQLRTSRVVLALEWMEGAEARRLIETLARGTPEARLTREAKAALQRLTARQDVVSNPSEWGASAP